MSNSDIIRNTLGLSFINRSGIHVHRSPAHTVRYQADITLPNATAAYALQGGKQDGTELM